MKKIILGVCVLAMISGMGSVFAQELNPTVKFNFLRGREAFHKKDYPTALKELKAYVAIDAQNHHALNLLAQTYQNLNNLKEAQTYYEKAIEAAPADTFAPIYSLNLGVLLYDQKKYDQALPHLTNAANKLAPFPKPFNEKKGLAYYYKAFIYYEREQWQDAKANFEKANYYSIDLKQGASFYLAICEYKLGNASAAKEGFKLAEKLNTSKALTDYSKQFLETMQSYKKPSGFGLTTGLQAMYDTNIFLEPKDYRSHSSVADEKGEVLGWIVEPNYRSSLWGGNLLGKYNFSLGHQVEARHRRYDSFSHKLSGIFAKDLDKEGKKKISFDTALGYSATKDHRRVNSSVSEDIAYGIEWEGSFSTDFQLSGAYSDYPSPESGVSADNRDAFALTLGENNSWYMANERLKVNLGVGLTRSEARGSTYDSTGLLGSLGFNFPFIGDSYMDLTGRLDYGLLANTKTLTGTGTLGVFKNWSSHISSSLGLSHIRGNSDRRVDNDPYRYDRNLVMLNLFYQI